MVPDENNSKSHSFIRQLTKAIKADTERIIAFMEHLNERLNYGVGNPHLLGISMKESRLQEATLKQLPDDSLLERYLDDVSDYAKTVCGDLSSIDFEPGDAGKKEGRPGVHASSRPTLTLQDLAGRQYALPFEDCKTWKVFRRPYFILRGFCIFNKVQPVTR